MIPTQILTFWLHGLLGFGLFGGAAYLIRDWYRRAWAFDPRLDRYVFDPDLGLNAETALLAGGLALLAWALLGGVIVRLALGLLSRAGGRDPRARRPPLPPGRSHRIRRPDGTELSVEEFGPEDALPVVLTHGWGANRTEWSELVRHLGGRYRLIAWDLPGLGKSDPRADRDYRLENLAGDLDAVLGLAGGRPAVLVGHSIGGMISLTYCKLAGADLASRVAGLVLVQTTYTNPVRTTKHAPLYTALERPVLVPLLRLTIALWPLAWLMTWMSYLNGSAHSSTRRTGFGGTQTPGQVDDVALYQLQAPPDVLARGMFGMLEYDATAVLPALGVPTLVVPGDRDPVCLPEASERIARDVPGAELHPLEPGKHMALIEHHERFARRVDQFLTTRVAGATPSGLLA